MPSDSNNNCDQKPLEKVTMILILYVKILGAKEDSREHQLSLYIDITCNQGRGPLIHLCLQLDS